VLTGLGKAGVGNALTTGRKILANINYAVGSGYSPLG
jgi:hypothetical protein